MSAPEPQDLRADLDRLEIVSTDDMPWAPSPSPTVWRKRLYRAGPLEAGRVTSVVRYDAGSAFHPHPHPDGEEIFVMDGVFQDERGDHPAGTLLLAAEGFEHAPRSAVGCTLFVRLRQYGGPGRETIRRDATTMAWRPHPRFEGVAQKDLYRHPSGEEIRLVRLAPGTALPSIPMPGGEEIVVLSGRFGDEHGHHGTGTWLRFPVGSSHAPHTAEGCTLYVKKGHLTRTTG